MTWYRTGTVTVTSGSANVTLAGGDALQNIFPDDGFVGPDGRTYAINTIGGAGSFTLQTPYQGVNAAGAAYLIVPVADYVQLREALEAINALITQYQDITLKAGVGLFLPGTAASPGVRGIGHEGTGLVWQGGALAISVDGTIVATFEASGKLITSFPDGSTSNPSIKFADDPDTGFYRPGANQLGMTVGGSQKLLVNSTTVRWAGELLVGFGADPVTYNFGIYPRSPFGGSVDYDIRTNDASNGAIEIGTMRSTGFVGMGTRLPGAKLHVKSNGDIIRLETTTPRGSGNGFVTLYDPSGRKGYWGYGGSDDRMYLMNEMSGPLMLGNNATFRVIIDGFSVSPQNDNVLSLGGPSNRWSVVYAATGTINTSDEREKNWIGEASPAAIAAGLQIIDELGFYTWIDGKREHFGPRAQRIWAICAEHGLVDPIGKDGKPGKTPLAFLCYDEWSEERQPIMKEVIHKAKFKGRGDKRVQVEEARIEMIDTGKTRVTVEAGDRYGVRTDQLTMFMTAALNAKRKEQDATIANLAAMVAALQTKVDSL